MLEHGAKPEALADDDAKLCGPVSQLVLRNRGAYRPDLHPETGAPSLRNAVLLTESGANAIAWRGPIQPRPAPADRPSERASHAVSKDRPRPSSQRLSIPA
jgi:hypothetical protein